MSKRIAIAVALAVAASGSGVAAADEVSELKSAVQALQKRLDQLESKAKEAEDTNDKQTDLIAKQRASATLPSGFTWKGDLRYRNENIEQQYARDRNRDRIRLRTGFTAKVNDTVTTEVQIATGEGADPRSNNQTLTGENIAKPIALTLAYATWQPHDDWKFTAGKMKYPWVRPGQSVLFDGDINPEGLAVNFGHGAFFASAFYTRLEERAGTLTTSASGQQPRRRAGGRARFDRQRVEVDARRQLLRLQRGAVPQSVLQRECERQHDVDGGGRGRSRHLDGGAGLPALGLHAAGSVR